MNQKSIKANALLNIIYTVSNIIFPLVTFPYVSRILLADGMGKVSFFSAISSYAVMLASLGISTYGIRATARVRDDKDHLSQVTIELLIINLVATVVVVAALIISSSFIEKFQTERLLLIINIILIINSTFSMSWLYSGLEQYSYVTVTSIIFKIISLIFVFIFVKKTTDYNKYAAITVFSTCGSYFLNFFYSKKFISVKNVKEINLKKHFKPMMLLFSSILAVNIYTNLDTVMLGFISGDREVGLYSIATKIKWILLSVVNAISAVLLPRLSYYFSEDRITEYNNVLKKSISYILLISIPLTIFFIIESKDCIVILGGLDYLDATLCMQIIMPILLISGFSNITGNQILIPLGKDSCFMKAVIVGAVVDLLLNALLMPKYSSIGAAISTLIAECAQFTIQLSYTYKYVKNNFDVSNSLKTAFSAIAAALILGFIKNIFFSKSWNNAMGIIFRISILFIIYLGLYGVFLLLLKENNSKEIIKEVVANIKLI